MRVLLADDHRLLVEGVNNLLTAHGLDVVGIANDGFEAIALAQTLNPDLILMDIRMPRCDGLQATRQIKAQQPNIQIVMLTTSGEDHDLFDSIKSGASGYLLKSMSGADFIDALRGLEQGAPPFSPGLAALLLREFARLADQPSEPSVPENPPAHLTARQTEVLRLVAAGLTYKEIGQRLALSERTVRYHMAEIMSKLHLEHRSQVIAYASKLTPNDGPVPSA